MGTEYTNDGGLGDMVVGKATGTGYNFPSSLGAQYHQPYSPPVSHAPPETDPVVDPVAVVAQPVRRCCQTNANQSLQGQLSYPLCRTELTPLGESSGAVKLEIGT